MNFKDVSIPGLKWVRFLIVGFIAIFGGFITIIRSLFRPFSPKNTHFFNALFTPMILKVLGVKVKVRGKEIIQNDKSYIIVGNHQSNLDLFLYGSLSPLNGVSLGKDSIKYIPLFGQAYWLAGNILVKRHKKDSRKASIDRAHLFLTQENGTLFIFPEGTRNPGPQLKEFKKGAFVLALETGVPIVPVCISRFANQVDYNKLNSGTIHIEIHTPISLVGGDLDQITQKVQNLIEEGIQKIQP